ncbi:MAG TPA: hypothetical protein VLY03_01955 [Bacteroidota bacterium]|nr:hypothetical protein [Bacteroidota bacterium]
MNRSTCIVACCSFLLILSSIARGDIIQSGSLQASSDGIDVTIRWSTVDESNVAYFDVQRSSGLNGTFVSLGQRILPKGPSLYQFIDRTAFMRTASVYQYRIVVYGPGDVALYTSSPITVTHSVSGVRRTWGSIKSLFR